MTPAAGSAIDLALQAFEPDERVLAMWLEGSFAVGDDDAASDVDLHLAVADEAFEAMTEDPRALLARIAPPLAFLDVPLTGARLLPSTLTGPLRVDLVVERRSAVASLPRHTRPRLLFDRDRVMEAIESAPPASDDPAALVESLLRNFWFGAMWPQRLTLRADWSTLLLNDIVVLHQYVVPAWLVADGSSEFYRAWFGLAKFLSPARRATLASLSDATVDAFARPGEGAPDPDRLARYHERLFATAWGALREAAAAADVPYPSATEDVFREYYRDELGIIVPPLGR